MIALEQLADGSVSGRNFQRLMSLVVDTGGVSLGLRVGGPVNVTWPGGVVSSNGLVVPHGLGGVPSFVVASLINSGSLAPPFAIAACAVYTATTFVLVATTVGAIPAAGIFSQFTWLAVG